MHTPDQCSVIVSKLVIYINTHNTIKESALKVTIGIHRSWC